MTDRVFDPDAYIASLPVRELRPPRLDAPTRFPTWRWPLPRSYNGFSGIERVRGWQVSRWLEAAECLTCPEKCEICCGGSGVAFHSETYAHIARAPALCRSCHRALHRRHTEWREWRSIVDAGTRTGEEWFATALRHGFDLAGHLRARRGWRAADLLLSPITALPPSISTALPGNLLSHPCL